jgi:hypothetical protein
MSTKKLPRAFVRQVISIYVIGWSTEYTRAHHVQLTVQCT